MWFVATSFLSVTSVNQLAKSLSRWTFQTRHSSLLCSLKPNTVESRSHSQIVKQTQEAALLVPEHPKSTHANSRMDSARILLNVKFLRNHHTA